MKSSYLGTKLMSVSLIVRSLITLSLITLGLSGCGIFSQTKPNNAPAQQVSCSGFADWQVCATKAARVCENGYLTIGKEENLVTQERIMHFSCKP